MNKKFKIGEFLSGVVEKMFEPSLRGNIAASNQGRGAISPGRIKRSEGSFLRGGNESTIIRRETSASSNFKKDLHEYSSFFAIKIKKLYRKIRQQNLKIYYLERENKRLQNLAFLDDLTQLANRRKFYLYLKQHCQGSRGRTTSLILGDVDFFKAYNDNYGHLAGDLCLQRIADAIQEALNGLDSPRESLAARYGGEEFAIVLPDTGLEEAMEIAEKIRLNIAAKNIPHAASEIDARITLSAGVSSQKAGKDLSPETLILAADRALYQAKNNGRDRVCSDT